MSDEKLSRLYQRAATLRSQAGGGAVALDTMVAVLEDRLGEAEKKQALLAIMSDAQCRKEFDVLRALVRESPGELPGVRRSFDTPWVRALAAVLVLAIGATLVWRAGDVADEPVRAGPGAGVVDLLAPTDKGTLAPSRAFAWRPAPGALRYSLDIVHPDGAAVYSTVVTDTTVVLPDSVRLAPGEYRWWVEASLNDGTQVRSPVRPLRITTP